MNYINILSALLALLLWLSLFLVYYHQRLIPWFVNKFTRDKNPAKNSSDGANASFFHYASSDYSNGVKDSETIEAAFRKDKRIILNEEQPNSSQDHHPKTDHNETP
ncbi:hypothetical protein GS501_03560 [Saccharibacter sp. 17.LH.SD]|uniref:hypothetical protein n=1 Tax=Saccharibacter sp. 17.LH.SD TaxID=2689393 RepID=UPI00136C4AC7|nr:hypothetical protein [Saccharibacter sp. 17.LH.SD]MXV44131.1 hypothetical protein [Saccharibacter sp. 17.LH.SD]